VTSLHSLDEDFVADKDDSGSPNDDSEEEDSDASMSRGEEEVTRFALTVSLFPVRTRISIVMQHANELLDPDSRILPRWKLVSQSRV